MTQLTYSEVEEWLDAHPDLSRDYFLRKADVRAINAWLVAHGFLTIEDYMTGGNNKRQAPASAATPNSSKRCLRHDFARSKSRSVFRTHEVITGIPKEAPSSRRSSLKDMRKYSSLPPNSINMLSLLIESKVRLPESGPAHSRAAKREQLRSQGERHFFLTVVRDLATDLDLKSLSQKTVDNLSVLLDADGASLFLVEGPKGGKQCLVSKVFDVHSGASRFLLPGGAPGPTGDNEIQVPWGVGVLGHVADTGETVNLQIACEVRHFITFNLIPVVLCFYYPPDNRHSHCRSLSTA
ncbi:hypothetical protein AAG570_002797 [Ranatra chinensis]|uniref:Uncharacterized protein n=1 Tax=Ranatra chinensis TaxID=642074 RepID=A0ABD0Y5I5_9HEMI